MRARVLTLLAAVLAVPAHGQQDHDAHAGHDMGAPADEHAGHDMGGSADEHAGHDMGGAADEHAGHDMAGSADEHAGHDMGGHAGHNMTLDATGMVMGANEATLPRDCAEPGPDVAFTVEAGAEFAADNPGTTFGYSRHEFEVAPCSRVTVTFVNRDQIRHQWMVHGLPRYLYAGGMFHLEAAGGATQTGTFIVPGDHKTYLVHCDVAQHMEKGMKGQLKVGRGSGDLWSVPGVSGDFLADAYLPTKTPAAVAAGAVLLALAAAGALRSRRRRSA